MQVISCTFLKERAPIANLLRNEANVPNVNFLNFWIIQKMIGSDTNVLVRAVLDDHPDESNLAKNFLKKVSNEKKLFISSYAILEMVWVLKTKKRTRYQIYESILDLLDSPGVVVGQREVIMSASEMYIKGKADFGDYLILAEGELYKAPRLASFDKTFCKDNSHAQNPRKYL